MSRPYFFDRKRRCYVTSGALLCRPTRNAAGMAYTANRGAGLNGTRMKLDACRLSVRGTCDELATRAFMRFMKGTCPCCGAKTGKLILSPFGRSRLARLRILQRKDTNHHATTTG